MLKLKKLQFKNIGRFVDLQTISFENLDSLIQIEGQNNNTGGSSGSAKSTIFNALAWLLGLDAPPTTILQSRLTDEPILVIGDFDWDGKSVQIKRSKKLTILVDGIETYGSSKITEEKLDEILKIPRNLFRPLLYKKQNESGFFLSMPPSKMSEFLTDCLGLGLLRSKIDSVEQKIKDISQAKINSESELQATQAVLESNKSAIEAIGSMPVIAISEDLVELYKNQVELSKSRLESIKLEQASELAKLNETKPKVILSPFNKSILELLEKEQKVLEVQISDLIAKEKDRQNKVSKDISDLKLELNNKISALKLESNSNSLGLQRDMLRLNNWIQLGESAKQEALKIADQIKINQSGICHTCKQSWITEEARLEEKRLLEEFSKHKSSVEKSIRANQEIEGIKSSLVELSERYNKQIVNEEIQVNAKIALLTELMKPQIPIELPEINSKLKEIASKKADELQKQDEHNAKENSKNQTLLNEFFVYQGELLDRQKKEINEAYRMIKENEILYESTLNQLKQEKHSLDSYKAISNSLEKKKEETNLKVVHITSKVIDLKEQLEVAEEVRRCLKSYLSCTFDDALESISYSATKLLRNIPNMANASIRLIGTKETGSGAVKETINAVIDNEGEIDIPIKSLSGGERSAVDLAVDLAVTQLIQEQGNIGCDILVLDEQFSGLDSICIEQALEMIKIFAQGRKVLLVEHNGVAKEFISQKITVIRTGETSIVKSA